MSENNQIEKMGISQINVTITIEEVHDFVDKSIPGGKHFTKTNAYTAKVYGKLDYQIDNNQILIQPIKNVKSCKIIESEINVD